MAREPHVCESCGHHYCAAGVAIFSSLTAQQLQQVVALVTRRQFEKGETIVGEGDRMDSLLILNRGRAKAFRNSPDGREQILYIFSSGDFFGERNLFQQRESAYSVEALEETGVCAISRAEFEQLLLNYPDIGLKIVQELSQRLERLEQAVAGMGTRSAETRVVSALLEFAAKYGREVDEGVLVELPLSQEGLGSYIGVARETVSRQLSNLQGDGTIRLVGNKKILILDKDALANSMN